MEIKAQEAAKPSYWQSRWREGRTGWDLGGVHPLFSELIDHASAAGLEEGGFILEPGCGRAHTGAALAGLGYKVTAFDVSQEAVDAAKKLYAHLANLELVVADLFALSNSWTNKFDAVYDRAVLCALPRSIRPAYVETCAKMIKPGGLFLSIPFTKLNIAESEGPPFAVCENDLEEMFTSRFEKVVHIEKPHLEKDSKIACEMLVIRRRK